MSTTPEYTPDKSESPTLRLTTATNEDKATLNPAATLSPTSRDYISELPVEIHTEIIYQLSLLGSQNTPMLNSDPSFQACAVAHQVWQREWRIIRRRVAITRLRRVVNGMRRDMVHYRFRYLAWTALVVKKEEIAAP
jgi:hypothetical protein